MSELYQKLPREIRNMLVFMPTNTTFEAMKQNLSHIRYWKSCLNVTNALADPMDIDCMREKGETRRESAEELGEDCVVGEGRLRRPVLRGNPINFHNIDGPRSLMVVWKKLVGTSGAYRREANSS